MSTNLLTLLRIQLKMSWRGFGKNMNMSGDKSSKWNFLLVPLLLLAFVPLTAMITALWIGLYWGAEAMGQGQVVLTLAVTAGQITCLLFGIFYVISAFYFSNDLKILVPLPLRPSEIVLSKFIGILVGEYATMLPVVLPAFLVYGLFADVAPSYFPFALLIFLLLPVIPLVLASLFSLVLMRVTNLRRNRDLWRVVGALVGISLAFVFQYVGRLMDNRNQFMANPEAIEELLAQSQGVIHSVGRLFPTSLWVTDALREGAPFAGVISFLLFTGVAVAALFLLTWAAERIFLGGLLGGDESRSSGKVLTRDELARETQQVRAPLWALLQREIRLLNRTPSFLMAAVLPVLMMPVFVAIPLMQDTDFTAQLARLPRMAASPLVPVFAIAAVLFMNFMSNVAATAISREGRFFWISRSLPVAPRIQVQAKLIHSLLFTTLNVVVVLGALGYLRLLSPVTFLSVLGGGFLASAVAAYGGILVDLMRPNLKWTDPQQAMKGNMNVLFAMLFIVLNGGLFALVSALLYSFARPVLLPGIVLLFGLEAATLSALTGRLADRRYVEYED